MIRLLHTADVHLGMAFPALGERGREQREQLKRTFARIVEVAVAERVQVLLIAGDLFHSHRQSEGTLAFVREQFLRLRGAGVRVALLAGNHDRLGEGSVWGRARFEEACDNVTLFGPEPQVKVYPDLDLAVVGQSVGPHGPQSLRTWPRGRAARFTVGLAHGSAYREGVVDEGAVHPNDLRDLAFDYVALGDWHTAQQVTGPPTPAWYAGAPEFLAMDQEAGQAILVTIPAPGEAEVTPVRVGRRRYVRLSPDVSGWSPDQIRARLAQDAGPETVLDVLLTGTVSPEQTIDAHELEEELAEGCFRVRIRNQTRLRLSEEALAAFPERTLVGRYIRLLRAQAQEAGPEEQGLLEEALQQGVSLLLAEAGAAPGAA